MKINEAEKRTRLTRKAIEYYTAQGLVAPVVLANGYRDYSERDLQLLEKIRVLRKLDVSTEEIRTILQDSDRIALQTVLLRKELKSQRDRRKRAVLEQLCAGKAYADVSPELEVIEREETITEKLLDAFPGYYGRFVCLHFARFLNEPIQSQEQQAAYDTIVAFLDGVPQMELPQDLADYLTEGTKHMGTEQIAAILDSTERSIRNPQEFLSDNKGLLEQYLAYLQADAYKDSPAYRLKQFMKEFNQVSGYDDVFIPAMKRLSRSYAAYYHQMEDANQKLQAQYPEIREW